MVNINFMDARTEINVLDYRLRVLSIPKASISKYTHAFLDVLFLKHYLDKTSVHDHHGFVSITETSQDYSVIVEEEALSCFDLKSGDVKVAGGAWLPMVASAGPVLTDVAASGISKIAKSVLIPLADNGVAVYCLSTYTTDYVLIQEADLNTACEVLAGDFRITREGVLDSMEIVVDPSRIRHPSGGADGCKPRPITHPITCLDSPFYVTSMDATSLSTHALTVLDLLFFSGKKSESGKSCDSFCNISIIEQDISLILDSSAIERFPQQILFNTSDCWNLIKIQGMRDGMAYNTAGIVAQISDPIASANISEYYISSFYEGHTLVPVEHFESVKRLMEERIQHSSSAL